MRARIWLIGLAFIVGSCGQPQYSANVSNTAAAAEETSEQVAEHPAAVESAVNAAEGASLGNYTADYIEHASGRPADAALNAFIGNNAVIIDNGKTIKIADDPQAIKPCDAIRGAPTTVARCRNLTAQKQSLEDGVAAFNPPRTMTLGQPTRVILPIGPKKETLSIIRAAGGAAGDAVSVDVKIGEHMTATLTGSAFAIEAVGDPKRDLGMSDSETWEWNVTPTMSGKQTLRIEIETFAEDEQGKRTRIALFRSSPITVDVAVTTQDKVRDTSKVWQAVIDAVKPLLESVTALLVTLGALILAAGVVWWRLRNFGRKPDDPEPE